VKVDGWDVIGGGGLALVCGGVVALWGWPWGAILLGVVLVGVYVAREVAASRSHGGSS
jgi:hypothetical protein